MFDKTNALLKDFVTFYFEESIKSVQDAEDCNIYLCGSGSRLGSFLLKNHERGLEFCLDEVLFRINSGECANAALAVYSVLRMKYPAHVSNVHFKEKVYNNCAHVYLNGLGWEKELDTYAVHGLSYADRHRTEGAMDDLTWYTYDEVFNPWVHVTDTIAVKLIDDFVLRHSQK